MAITNPEFTSLLLKNELNMFNLEDELGYVDDTFVNRKYAMLADITRYLCQRTS